MIEETRTPGTVIGSYEILEEIGRGGLGIVYRSRHVHLGRLVALKILHPLWTSSPEFVERFREEGRVMALLEHPNICRVYDAGQVGSTFYLAMSYLEGEPLERLLGSPLPIPEALRIARQVAAALRYAHDRGVIHRDIKPANIVVGPDGHVTLTDFGVARLRNAPGLTLPGVRVGTPYYMAPEQILGQPADPRADLYSLGVVLYQMLSGALPFPGPSTEEVYEGHLHQELPPLGEETPAWLRDVVRRALAKSPDERFPDAASFLEALEPPEGRAVPLPTPARDLGDPVPTRLQAREPVRQDRTALSLDVAESSRMKHPGLTLVVQSHFARFRDYVRQHLDAHGCLASIWAGDGLLALFDGPARGAACASAILEGLEVFNRSGAGSWEPFRVRIGLHHGSVLWSEGQPLGEVTSRTLDLAARLQKSCSEDSALLSESVYAGLADTTAWAPAESEGAASFPFRIYRWVPPGQRDAPERPRPSPSGVSHALRVEVTSGETTRTYLVRGEALIGRPDPKSGRVPDVEIRDDDAVSRRHARIFAGAGGFYLEDLDSANGTCLNGRWLQPHSPALLREGDLIELGERTRIRVGMAPAGAD